MIGIYDVWKLATPPEYGYEDPACGCWDGQHRTCPVDCDCGCHVPAGFDPMDGDE